MTSNGRFTELLQPSADMVEDLSKTANLMEYSFTVGFLLGGLTSAKMALLQFNAEHQHYLPLQTRSDHVVWVRNRNYRAMAAFGAGGFKRGAQMAGVCAVYMGVRMAFREGRERMATVVDTRLAAIDEIVAGMAAGGLFAIAGKGHRLYYLRRGLILGGLLGASLASLRLLQSSIDQDKE